VDKETDDKGSRDVKLIIYSELVIRCNVDGLAVVIAALCSGERVIRTVPEPVNE